MQIINIQQLIKQKKLIFPLKNRSFLTVVKEYLASLIQCLLRGINKSIKMQILIIIYNYDYFFNFKKKMNMNT